MSPTAIVRLDAVHASTADLKEREQAVGAAALIGLTEYAAPTLLGLAARAAHGQRFANIIVTNIPGPQVPLYCLGAQMLEVYPIVPLSRNLTINVAVMSYCGAAALRPRRRRRRRRPTSRRSPAASRTRSPSCTRSRVGAVDGAGR